MNKKEEKLRKLILLVFSCFLFYFSFLYSCVTRSGQILCNNKAEFTSKNEALCCCCFLLYGLPHVDYTQVPIIIKFEASQA